MIKPFDESTSKLATLACVTLLSFGAMSVLSPDEARADVLIGLDANGGFNIGELSADGLGLGANLRVGYELPIPVLRVAPELQLNYMGFALSDLEGSTAVDTAQEASIRTFSARGGLRVGFSAVVGASLFGHVGYGTATTRADDFEANGAGLSFDAGIAFDFTLIPFVNLGVHAALNYLDNTAGAEELTPLRWIDTGVHVEVVF